MTTLVCYNVGLLFSSPSPACCVASVEMTATTTIGNTLGATFLGLIGWAMYVLFLIHAAERSIVLIHILLSHFNPSFRLL